MCNEFYFTNQKAMQEPPLKICPLILSYIHVRPQKDVITTAQL